MPRNTLAIAFGTDKLVACHSDPARAQKLIDSGCLVSANAILAACFVGNADTLKVLLPARPDPNIRLEFADSQTAGVAEDWYSSDLQPWIETDKREWYPLQLAADYLDGEYGDRVARRRALDVLLSFQPDLFAVFKQPLGDPFHRPSPGHDTAEPLQVPTPTSDTSEEQIFSRHVTNSEWQSKPGPKYGYGVRSVLHSIFEDGFYTKPILEHPHLKFDTERQDPQGRTLIHAVCRNQIGADSTLDAVMADVRPGGNTMPLTAPDTEECSLFHIVRKRGANVNAEDSNGKNVLHHLLEARNFTWYYERPPHIRNALRYVLANFPHLVNQADCNGTFPLHSALQRLRAFANYNTIWRHESALELVVQDLLDFGAEPSVRDGRGNTALHWLADSGITEMYNSAGARALFVQSCDAGVDVNIRNKRGRTALEILMDDDGENYEVRQDHGRGLNPGQRQESLIAGDIEVFQAFDKAAVHWTEVDPEGRTLLHLVALHSTPKAKHRARFLLSKGVDPNIKDAKGRTALDVAVEFRNEVVEQVLSGNV